MLGRNKPLPCFLIPCTNIAILQIHFMKWAYLDARNLMHPVPVTLTVTASILYYTSGTEAHGVGEGKTGGHGPASHVNGWSIASGHILSKAAESFGRKKRTVKWK